MERTQRRRRSSSLPVTKDGNNNGSNSNDDDTRMPDKTRKKKRENSVFPVDNTLLRTANTDRAASWALPFSRSHNRKSERQSRQNSRTFSCYCLLDTRKQQQQNEAPKPLHKKEENVCSSSINWRTIVCLCIKLSLWLLLHRLWENREYWVTSFRLYIQKCQTYYARLSSSLPL